MQREYKVGDKIIKVTISILKEIPPMVVIDVNADKDIVQKYFMDNGFSFALYLDDILDAIREAVSELARD
jgi:hypothetical protein